MRDQFVITEYLREGKNNVRLIAKPIQNGFGGRDMGIQISGPVEWNVAQNTFVYQRTLLKANSYFGWKRDEKTGRLISKGNPDDTEVVQEFSIDVEKRVVDNN